MQTSQGDVEMSENYGKKIPYDWNNSEMDSVSTVDGRRVSNRSQSPYRTANRLRINLSDDELDRGEDYNPNEADESCDDEANGSEMDDLVDQFGGTNINHKNEFDENMMMKYDQYIPVDQDDQYDLFLQKVQHKLFHLDHVKTELKRGLDKVLKNGEGTILTIYGKKSSGKRTLINRVIKRHDDEFNFDELNGRFVRLLDVKMKLRILKERLDEKKPLVFVLYNFDALRVSFANKVLYTLTNYLRRYPFFLLLVTEKESAVEALEKRIVSRVGQSSIKCMDHRMTTEDCWELVRKLVKSGFKACDDKQLKHAFKLPEEPPKNFEHKCNSLPNYAQLKLFVKELADHVFESVKSETPIDLSQVCEQLLMPFDEMTFRLRSLTDRMYGVLIAVGIATHHITKPIPVKRCFQQYKRFLNTYKINIKSLSIEKEHEFIEDLEYLVFQRFLLARRQNQKIVSVTWLDDPLSVLNKKYVKIFHTCLEKFLSVELKDDRQLY